MTNVQKNKNKQKSSANDDGVEEIIADIGQTLKKMWLTQFDSQKDISESELNASELLKTIQMIDKYLSLKEKISPPQQDAIQINHQLIWNYLNKQREAKKPS